MTVAYILGSYPRISETFILNEILELGRRGVTIEIFSIKRSDEKVTHLGVQKTERVHYLPQPSPLRMLRGHIYWLFRNPAAYLSAFVTVFPKSSGLRGMFLSRLMDVAEIGRVKADHLHAHFGGMQADLALLTHLFTGIPFTFTTHRRDIFDVPPRNYVLKTKKALKHITISEFNKRYLAKEFGLDPQKIAIVHCGINFKAIPEGERSEKEGTIVCVARLGKEKAIENLIRASALLKQRGVDHLCRVIGEGPERPALEKLIAELGVADRVELLGSRPSDFVFKTIRESSVLALPSRSEGIPVAMMEAMALGTPVVGPDVTGVPELVTSGESGFLVEPDRPELLADRIEALLKDPRLRRRFASLGHKKVFEEFNLERQAEQLLEIWSSRG